MDKSLVNNSGPYAVVIGLDCITGLQTARILAGHGIRVIGIATDPEHFCCRTSVCERILFTDTGTTAFIELLQMLGPKLHAGGDENRAVLYPCIDMTVLLLSRHREMLTRWYHVALPEPDVVEMLMNKINFYTYAQEHGLPVPGTYMLHNRRDAERAAAELTFPGILKPPMRDPLWLQNSPAKVFKVSTPEELLALYDRCAAWADVLMVQEWIDGTDADLYSCNVYFDARSEPLVVFSARKIRQWPPRTGTSCLGVEVRNDAVQEQTLNLFRGVNYHGLGYLEMKRDARSGKHYIIEPNIGRPTGRSALAEAGGVALLYTMYCDLTGRPLPANRQQQYVGTKWIYWRHDLQSALYYWWQGELSLRAWLDSWRGRKGYAVFSWTDRAPFWGDLRKSARLLMRMGKRTKREQVADGPVVDNQPVDNGSAGPLEEALLESHVKPAYKGIKPVSEGDFQDRGVR